MTTRPRGVRVGDGDFFVRFDGAQSDKLLIASTVDVDHVGVGQTRVVHAAQSLVDGVVTCKCTNPSVSAAARAPGASQARAW